MPSVAHINTLCYRQKQSLVLQNVQSSPPPPRLLSVPTRLLLTSSPSLPSPPALASTSRNEVILVWWETMSRQTKYAHTWAFYRLIRWPLAGCTAGSAPLLSSLCLQKLHRDWPFSPAPKYNFHSAYTRNVGGEGAQHSAVLIFVCFMTVKVNLNIKSLWLIWRLESLRSYRCCAA